MMDTNTDEASYVTVNVHGSLRIPLHLDLLKNLNDHALEKEILKESINIAIGEYLGWFNHLDITFGSCETSGKSTERATMQPCEANIPLEDLGTRIKAIQEAYDNIMRQVATLKDLLLLSQQEQKTVKGSSREESLKEDEEGLNNDDAVDKVGEPQIPWDIFKERDAAMLTLVESVLDSPASIVDAACQIEKENPSLRSTQDVKQKPCPLSSEKPLLEENYWQSDYDSSSMADIENTEKDYASMGYMPL